MGLYVLVCNDKPDSLELRLANREAHLAYARGFADRLKVAGPLLDEAGNMAGSLLILEAESLEGARAFNLDDPYQKAGLFASVQVTAFKATIGGL
ncbi:YciI family protein [Phenylobacterium sp.]|uniref:YciI family protein n=1 Tax=Phenylobacterium sp. TaxID=1871053 RepID=UPI0025CF0AFC|nr:YciI family protein [Phenylobacterium sp.]MCA6285527.1 YciI family protein [Phenylobacterium sp.]MCA6289205.1 YciI family protein [Phenylobacterium sp.]MCA6309456.1 YciI family protein [Phenylobacterium sp.]MCA6323143.1 YciI family protein [Phenylobacterium sp.]MCA6337433.1 YciI family protein [Phenylobacterium sp.]